MTVRPAKTQISLGIRPVWSESSLSAWRKLGSVATSWAHSEDSDQTGRMPRLIWVFAGRTCHFVGFDMKLLKVSYNKDQWRIYLISFMKVVIPNAYLDDLRHQGGLERATSMIRHRFSWPDIQEKVQMCDRCLKRYNVSVKATALINITSTTLMDLACIDYLTTERSKGCTKISLFSRTTVAVLTKL